MSSSFGDFSEDGREYIITRRDLPSPWLNYLTNGDYLALASFQGGGFSSYLEQRFNSLTRRYPNLPQSDMPGRFVYVRDQETGEYWSATGHPVGKCDSFRAVIGLGYTHIETAYAGIAHRMTYFVPKNPHSDKQGEQEPCEIWRLKVSNESDRPRKLRIYSYSEWLMGDVEHDMRFAPFFKLFRRAKFRDGTIYGNMERWGASAGGNAPWPYTAFFASTRPPVGHELATERFVGRFRTLVNPVAVEFDAFSSEEAFQGDDVCGSLVWDLELAPGASESFDMVLGMVPDDAAGFQDLPAKYREPATVERAWGETRGWWDDFLGGLEVDTPDAELNRQVNLWNKYQIFMTCSFGRGPSYFHADQTVSMRDSLQDSFGMIPLDASRARENILRTMSFQYADGSPTATSNRMGMPEEASDKVDLPVWLALVLDDYLAETGDWDILEVTLPFFDEGEGTLYEHLQRGLNRVSADRGARGLPLIGRGDWNDALNGVGADGKGESVWLGQFLSYAFRLASRIAERIGDTAHVAQWRTQADELKERINAVAWDGEWYVRAFDDDGKVVGGKACDEGRIYLNAQTWAVLTETASPERAEACMRAVFAHLLNEHGLAANWPAYTNYDPKIGVLSQFPPGKKENAACFTHAGAFNLVAMAKTGFGDEMHRAYRAMLPALKPQPHFRMEPYIFSQYCAGPESPDFGQGAFHWMTGSASWMFRAVVDWMLGLRPEYDGFLVDPCMPKTWPEFRVVRPFREGTYQIHVTNPSRVNTGVASVSIDGADYPVDQLLPIPEPGETL
ncbi:MAG: hypothetical protein GWP08_12370, partial [Nitrospiraceae bacterium]|nr:hypothetical protein [Nitrospiraceae bacterium]